MSVVVPAHGASYSGDTAILYENSEQGGSAYYSGCSFHHLGVVHKVIGRLGHIAGIAAIGTCIALLGHSLLIAVIAVAGHWHSLVLTDASLDCIACLGGRIAHCSVEIQRVIDYVYAGTRTIACTKPVRDHRYFGF